MRENVVVIPCFNERARLDAALVEALVASGRITVLLVDDGSSDGTGDFIDAIAARLGPAVAALRISPNVGKAEAVRRGLRHAIADGAATVGFADADFATPPSEIERLWRELDVQRLDVVLGSRIARIGADIERSPVRHAAGRVFATIAALALHAPVYDTQCGAKWFRVDARLERALDAPFASRWAFDVELLGRLLGRFGYTHETEPRILEVPLLAWRDVDGSKLHLGGMIRGFGDTCALLARSIAEDARRR